MPIEVGDRVIHPQHGLGQVTSLVVKQFVEEKKRPFAAFLQNIMNVLCQEWAAVEGIPPAEAASEVQSLLEKGKLANDNN